MENDIAHRHDQTQTSAMTFADEPHILSANRTDENANQICKIFENSFSAFLGRSWHPERILTPTERHRLVEGMRLMRQWIDLKANSNYTERRIQMENDLGIPEWLWIREVNDWITIICPRQDRRKAWDAARVLGTANSASWDTAASLTEFDQIGSKEIYTRLKVRLNRDRGSKYGGLCTPHEAYRGLFALFDCYQEAVAETCFINDERLKWSRIGS